MLRSSHLIKIEVSICLHYQLSTATANIIPHRIHFFHLSRLPAPRHPNILVQTNTYVGYDTFGPVLASRRVDRLRSRGELGLFLRRHMQP